MMPQQEPHALSTFDGLTHSTENILAHALWLAEQKELLSKSEYRKLLKQHGWKNEDKRYLKVATVFSQLQNQDLSQIEPATIFRLANNPKKYQSVIDQLQNIEEINQAVVRELIAQQRQPKEPKEEQPSIWRRTRDGRRYCQIPPIHEVDERTGTTLQKMMETEGLSTQQIIAESVALRQAYIEGRLVLVEQTPPAHSDSSLDTESATVEVPLNRAINITQTSNDSELEEIDTIDTTTSYTEALLDEELVPGTWTYEPEPESDDIDGYEEYAVTVQPQQELETEARSPVELLIETFQIANTWEPIREALLVYEDYKQQAWESLTPVEKKRVRELMPIEVKKLSEVKQAGLIVDFKELREGVYQVRRTGNVLGEVVSSSRLDAFLAQLQHFRSLLK
ncbi:MAG: hypothetical protein SAK29_20935 [Scytonema sp. PMC 1069.18]|nr:hypothetical protein [Scytonema sp. PMC 1069.18]MEC4886715.1 hypothetical protein [Scytonema sp. PMC 1070.18]